MKGEESGFGALVFVDDEDGIDGEDEIAEEVSGDGAEMTLMTC